MSGREVLVTGAAGFIGSHLARAFLARGDRVTALDDLSSGREEQIPPGARFVRADLASSSLAPLDGRAFDIVVHCAAQTNVRRSMVEPALDRSVNLDGTMRLVEAIRDHGHPRFIFFSTGGAIYGERSEPAGEDAPIRPRSFYGLHKFAAEGYVSLSGVSHAILRPSNVYGPGQRADNEGGVVAIFARRLMKSLPLVVQGDGKQLRDFIYIGDVVAATLALADSTADGVWNVGTGNTTSVLELIEGLEAVTGRVARIEYVPSREGDLFYSCLDPSRLVATELWRPRVSLEEGLRLTVAGVTH